MGDSRGCGDWLLVMMDAETPAMFLPGGGGRGLGGGAAGRAGAGGEAGGQTRGRAGLQQDQVT